MIMLPEQRIEQIIDAVLREEGGAQYTNDPSDAGGETRYGITAAVARANGYTGPMRDLPERVARAIVRRRYIDEPRFGDVVAIDPALGAELIESGVNLGTAVAATFLQRLLNGFNDTGQRYAALAVDGRLGNVSLDALRAFLRWRGPLGLTTLLRGLNGLQAAHYITLAERKPTQRRFLFGWIAQRVVI